MTLHKEGIGTIILSTLLGAGILTGVYFLHLAPLFWFAVLVVAVFYGLVLWFFRRPNRPAPSNATGVIAPADGKVVVIEETTENEYFKGRCLQVSIFMSPLNVHMNWYPMPGKVVYYKYHKGKKMVAWHPKASELNERSSVVIKTNSGKEILMRQIAGAVARRIVCYTQNGDAVEYGSELGFIKFGSRVDLYLPLGTKVNVNIGDKVSGNITQIATL